MFEKQNGKCAICNFEFSLGRNNQANIDHNHKTGKIRGLLCKDCNITLGNIKEDINILNTMISYINYWSD